MRLRQARGGQPRPGAESIPELARGRLTPQRARCLGPRCDVVGPRVWTRELTVSSRPIIDVMPSQIIDGARLRGLPSLLHA
jgi:hypothetical protein